MNDYPEHEKLIAVKVESQAQGELLDWLNQQDYTICRWVSTGTFEGSFEPVTYTIESLLAQFHDIDLEKIEAEKRMMLRTLRS